MVRFAVHPALLLLILFVSSAQCTPAQQRRWETAAWASLGCAAQAAASVLAGAAEIVRAAERGDRPRDIGVALVIAHGVPLARCIVEHAVAELAGGDGVAPGGLSSPPGAAAAIWLREHSDEWAYPALDVRGVHPDAPR